MHFCVGLNGVALMDAYQMPQVDELIDRTSWWSQVHNNTSWT